MTYYPLCKRLRLYSVGEQRIRGTTTSAQSASGLHTSWMLDGAGTSLLIWDTTWSTAEREVVLGRPEPMPEMPLALAQLMGRRRATVEVASTNLQVMTVRLVIPDSEGWPRFRSCSRDELEREAGHEHVEALTHLGVLDIGSKQALLGTTGRNRAELCALIDPAAPCAASALYVVTRVIPTLRRTGMVT